MPSILKHYIVAIAGDLGDFKWTEEDVKRWVQSWGGKFSNTVDSNVTHLLCTRANYKKRISPVKQALENKVTKIVKPDWLADCTIKKKRLNTLGYQLDEEEKKEKAKKRKQEQMKKFSSNAEKYVDERFWHVYRDSTYFEYKIELKRANEESGGVPEKHMLTLWESKAKPHNYICTTIHTKSKQQGRQQRFPDSPVRFDAALKKFQSFFKKRTNISWDDRIEKFGTTGLEYFQYQPPVGGKPVGLLPGRCTSFPGKAAQHENGSAEELNAVDTPHKRPREEDVTDVPTKKTRDVERPAKKARLERRDIGSVSAETQGGSAEQAIIIDSDSESEKDNPHNQDCAQETRQDLTETADGMHGVQPEPSSVANSGVPQLHDRYEQENPEVPGENSTQEIASANNPSPQENASAAEEATEVVTLLSPLSPVAAHNEVRFPEVEDDYYTYDNSPNADLLRTTTEGETQDISSPSEASLARARAVAENIYHETRRGVSLVSNSEAELIDMAYQKRAHMAKRAGHKKTTRGEDEGGDSAGGVADSVISVI
ncbi:hypothetical protein F5Y03DRAFT_389994 [Xylaria venustula]|nr:hypothetical protein F5Y03DRAFT_389994 [Xylaria venustula]